MQENNYVSSFTFRLKKRLREAKDKDIQRREEIKDIIDLGIGNFAEKMKRGEVDIGVPEFEKLVKLYQLLDDKPTEIVGEGGEVKEQELQVISESDKFADFKEDLLNRFNARNERGERDE